MAYTKHYPPRATVPIEDGDGTIFGADGEVSYRFDIKADGNLPTPETIVNPHLHAEHYPDWEVVTRRDGHGVTIDLVGKDADGNIYRFDVEVGDSSIDRIRLLIEQHPNVFGKLNGECPYQRAADFLESMTK